MKKQTKIFISIIIGLILLPIVLFLAWLLFMNIGTGESPASLEEIALVSPDNQRVVIAQTLAAQPNLGGVRVLQEKYKAEVIIHLDCSLLDTPGDRGICIAEQDFYKDLFGRLDWSEVVTRPQDELRDFDCNKIYETQGRIDCSEYKKTLN